MTDTAIDAPEAEAGQGEPEPAVAQPETDAPEPQEDSPQDVNLSAEAKGWRLKFRDQQQVNAELMEQQADIAAKLRAAEKALIDQHVGPHMRDVEDFWSRTEHSDLLGEDGVIEMSKVDTQLSTILAAHPYYAAPAPGMPAAASAEITGDSRIGMRPFGVLDPSQVAQAQPTWADVLGGTVDEMRPPEAIPGG